MRKFGQIALQIGLLLTARVVAKESESVSFNRDVRPILSEHCFTCHGPNKAKGGLRFNSESGATNALESGHTAIVPGNISRSELVRRINSGDPEERMPPPDKGKALSEAQIKMLERWIGEGARWEKHWAFQPVRRPVVPAAKFPDYAFNPIDAFIPQKPVAARVPCSCAPRIPRGSAR